MRFDFIVSQVDSYPNILKTKVHTACFYNK